MNEYQFLKEEIRSPKFNKRMFYAKNSKKYIEMMSINLFINSYIPFITSYVFNDENTEEVLTEYSKTFSDFLKYLGQEDTFKKYLESNTNNEIQKNEEESNYNKSIFLILKCYFEKFFINEDEILKETAIINMKELLLELDHYSLLKKEIEKYLNFLMNKNNEDSHENKDINEENEVLFLIFGLLYPLIINDENKIENYCNKFKLFLKNNNQLKKKRLLIQNIINIIPFIKSSIEKNKDNSIENDNNIINHNIYIIKEIISSLNIIMDDKNLIILVGMNYLCEIIIIYVIQNITDFIIFYDEYNNILSNKEINSSIINFISKLENLINNESNLNISLTWRIKVAYIENICRLKKYIIKYNPNYFNDYFSNLCIKILEDNDNEPDLKVSVLKHIEFFIPKLSKILPIFKNIFSLETNINVRSNMCIALNRIINNQQFYNLNKNNSNLKNIISNIFSLIQNIIDKEKFEVKYYLLSTFEFQFFNIINDDNDKIAVLKKSIKLIIIVFESINEWRIRYNIYDKFEKFLLNKENFLKIINIFQNEKENNVENSNVIEMINSLRYLIQLFFNDKANIIRTHCLQLINNIINMQITNNIRNEIWLIRIKNELIKYQYSLFCKNNNFDENDNFINEISSLNVNKNYYIKIFFLESVKKLMCFYSKEEKNIIKEIVNLIKKDKKYPSENVANNKILNDVEFILVKLNEE